MCKCLNGFADHKRSECHFVFYEPLCQQQILCLENLFCDTIQSKLSLPLNSSNWIGVQQSSLHSFNDPQPHNKMCGSSESFWSQGVFFCRNSMHIFSLYNTIHPPPSLNDSRFMSFSCVCCLASFSSSRSTTDSPAEPDRWAVINLLCDSYGYKDAQRLDF